MADFKRDRTSSTNTDGDPSSGRQKTASLEEMERNVHKILLKDRRLKLAKIASIAIAYTETETHSHDRFRVVFGTV